MQTLPTRNEGHLVVAAIRVLRHREERPPTDEEIAALLKKPREEVAHRVRGLVRHGVLRAVESAFDVRYELDDPAALETLEESADDRALQSELEAFETKSRERHADLAELFGKSDAGSRERTSRLEAELEKFRSSGRARTPFDPTAGTPEDTEDDG